MATAAPLLQPIGEDIWVHSGPLRFSGVEIGRHMVVIRLPDGALLVQSPAPLTDELHAALAALGDVRHVAAASRLHGHLHMERYRAAFPGALLYAPPGLERKRPDLRFDAMLFRGAPAAWGDHVDVKPVEGFPRFTEVELLHRPSGTLILGDLCYNVTAATAVPPATKVLLRLVRSRGLTPTLDLRTAMRLHRRDLARRSVADLLTWSFDQIVVGHGDRVTDRAHERLRAAFAWLLDGVSPPAG